MAQYFQVTPAQLFPGDTCHIVPRLARLFPSKTGTVIPKRIMTFNLHFVLHFVHWYDFTLLNFTREEISLLKN